MIDNKIAYAEAISRVKRGKRKHTMAEELQSFEDIHMRERIDSPSEANIVQV